MQFLNKFQFSALSLKSPPEVLWLKNGDFQVISRDNKVSAKRKKQHSYRAADPQKGYFHTWVVFHSGQVINTMVSGHPSSGDSSPLLKS